MKGIASNLCLICFQLFFLLSNASDSPNSHTKTKTVSTLLNAKWNSTPISLEIAEFLNDEDPLYFWSFLEDLIENADTFTGSKCLIF